MNVLGLDLSLAATGWALGDDHGVIATSPKATIGERLEQIRERVDDLVAGADLVVIEDLPHHVKHGGPQLGMVHGIVRLGLHVNGLAPIVALVAPASLKTYATGRGNAPKADIRMELYKRFDVDIRDDNAADAFVLRAMGLDHLGAPLVAMPQTHRRALDKVAWPTHAQEAA